MCTLYVGIFRLYMHQCVYNNNCIYIDECTLERWALDARIFFFCISQHSIKCNRQAWNNLKMCTLRSLNSDMLYLKCAECIKSIALVMLNGYILNAHLYTWTIYHTRSKFCIFFCHPMRHPEKSFISVLLFFLQCAHEIKMITNVMAAEKCKLCTVQQHVSKSSKYK